MTLLKRLRGEVLQQSACFGQTLFIYKQGLVAGLLTALATFIFLSLPSHLFPFSGQVILPLIAAIGFYVAANLCAVRAPNWLTPEDAAKHWI